MATEPSFAEHFGGRYSPYVVGHRLPSMTEGELQEALVRMNAFNEELRKAGVMRDCDRLQPSKEGKHV